MKEHATPPTPDDDSPASRQTEATARQLHAAAIHLLRRVRDVDQDLGLSAARLSALSYLVFAGPASIGELARVEQVTPASISQLVNGMVRDKLAERLEDPNDGRGTLVAATPGGQKLLERGRDARVKVLSQLLNGLKKDDLDMLVRAASLIEERVS